MRDYSKAGPRFWTGTTGKRLRGLGRDAQVLGFYLFTCPNANMLGLYYLPLQTAAHETGIEIGRLREILSWFAEAPSKPLGSPSEGVYARYDEATETVFVTEMARHQIGERLIRKDNRHRAVLKELEQHRKCPFFNDFLARYRDDFNLQDVDPMKPLPRALQAPSKPEAGAGAESRAGTRTETGEGERGALTAVPRETSGNPQGAIAMGDNLTRSTEEIHGAMLEDWRRDVPTVNQAAMAQWIVHKEARGHQMGPRQRLIQARELASKGDSDAQAEIVEYCIGHPYYSLIPIEDVRARKNGRGRNAPPSSKTAEQREAEEMRKQMQRRAGTWTHGITMADFREPQAGETAEQYHKALDREFHERLNRKLQPQISAQRAGATK